MAKRKSRKSKKSKNRRKSPKRVAAGKKAARTRKRRRAERARAARKASRHRGGGRRKGAGRRKKGSRRKGAGRRRTSHGVAGLQKKLRSLRKRATKDVHNIQHGARMAVEADRLRALIKRDNAIARAARASAHERAKALKAEARAML